jgi:myo-inositol-1(or 4)-monophosphatase
VTPLDAAASRGQIARSMAHSALLNVMIAAARKAGRALKRDFGEIEKLQVSLKGPANFVSAADRRAEETLYAELSKARPGYGFLGEEAGQREGADKTHTWIVDPLDGTTNFLHGIPQFCISIGLQREGTGVAGLIYNPANEELFVAERGKGAFLNDQRIRVAARRRLADAVIACGLPHLGRADIALGHRETNAVQGHVAGLRRFGAAALDLAWVAAGRLDGYWERDIKPWDMAAGLLIVREAGGFVSDCDGADEMMAKGHIVAGNETIHKELLKALKSA